MFHFTALGDGLMNCSTENGQRFCACDKIEKWMVGFEKDAFDKASFFSNNRRYKISKFTHEWTIFEYIYMKKRQNKKKRIEVE